MTQQEKTFIVQNVTQGPVCISDIGKKGLTIQALSIHDLRTNDPEEVQRSEGLSKALRLGLLREVSADYASKDEVKKTTAQRQDIIDKLKQYAVRSRYDNDEAPENITAEELSEELSTIGQANDPVSYAIAFDVYAQKASMQGKDASPEEFRDKVNKNPGMIKDLIISGTHANVEDTFDDDYEEPQLKKISKKGSKPVVKEPEFDEPLTEIDLTKDL